MFFFRVLARILRPKPCNVFPLATLNIDKTGRSWGPTMQLATQWRDQESDDPAWFVDDFGCHHWYSDIMVLSCIYHVYIYISCIIITWSAIYVCYWHLLTSDIFWPWHVMIFATDIFFDLWGHQHVGWWTGWASWDRSLRSNLRSSNEKTWILKGSKYGDSVIQIFSWISKGYNSGY